MPNVIKQLTAFLAFGLVLGAACHSRKERAAAEGAGKQDRAFSAFEARFLDAYWSQHPGAAIGVGYGKYYDELTIPDSASRAADLDFNRRWMDSLTATGYDRLNDNNKVSFKIIQNELESETWYATTFRDHEWNAAQYNLSGDCDYLLNQPYAPLDQRLVLLTRHLAHADAYFRAALQNLHRPVKEYVELSILQNQGGLDVLGAGLTDSIHASHLTKDQKDSLQTVVARTVTAIKGFVDSLKAIVGNKHEDYRDFRIGKALFAAKFKYDLATDWSPEELYNKAISEHALCHSRVLALTDSLWPKYFGNTAKPRDSVQVANAVLDKIQLKHARPADFLDSATSQLHQLKKFIVVHDLFAFDTAASPIEVRLMPVYERGVTVASAEQAPPYQKKGTAYYNVDDLTKYDPKKAEGALREANDYASQILAIHEAMPGHCLQLTYSNKKSPDVLRSVFQNGAMIEGWAVYCEGMMLEDGWGDHAPELELMRYKWRLRELGNVIIDYGIQCLNMTRDSVMNFLVKDCFQTEAQATEKWHRATVSQVQLCSYYSGASAILALREEYQKKMGSAYSLKEFHERFLSFGSSPVKYIRERMLHQFTKSLPGQMTWAHLAGSEKATKSTPATINSNPTPSCQLNFSFRKTIDKRAESTSEIFSKEEVRLAWPIFKEWKDKREDKAVRTPAARINTHIFLSIPMACFCRSLAKMTDHVTITIQSDSIPNTKVESRFWMPTFDRTTTRAAQTAAASEKNIHIIILVDAILRPWLPQYGSVISFTVSLDELYRCLGVRLL